MAASNLALNANCQWPNNRGVVVLPDKLSLKLLFMHEKRKDKIGKLETVEIGTLDKVKSARRDNAHWNSVCLRFSNWFDEVRRLCFSQST